MTPDARLILREEELDASIELFVLAEAALWATAITAPPCCSNGGPASGCRNWLR
jgi:hypothetical protein